MCWTRGACRERRRRAGPTCAAAAGAGGRPAAAAAQSLTVRTALAWSRHRGHPPVGVGTYLTRGTAAQLEERDEGDLIGEVLVVRHLLRGWAPWTRCAGLPIVSPTGPGPRRPDPDGAHAPETLINCNPRHEQVPPLRVLPAEATPGREDLQVWHPRNGVASSGIAALGRIGDSDEAVEIVVARDAGYRAVLMVPTSAACCGPRYAGRAWRPASAGCWRACGAAPHGQGGVGRHHQPAGDAPRHRPRPGRAARPGRCVQRHAGKAAGQLLPSSEFSADGPRFPHAHQQPDRPDPGHAGAAACAAGIRDAARVEPGGV